MATWDSIPAANKEPNGAWVNDYGGFLSIGCNAKLVSTCPKTMADLAMPDYKGKVALNGDPTQDGLLAQYYAQAINKNAPHPAAARLWQEYLFSDEGQNLWLAGKARPVRLDAVIQAGTADKTLLAALPPVQGEPQFPPQAETDAAQQVVAQQWASATA